jgi:predicted molibdopterin-dependent oxidoreductase YjgC
VQERRDALTGAVRESVLISADDVGRLGLADGAEVLLRSDHGELRGKLMVVEIAPGSLQVYWPEGNVLLGPERSAESGIPDYNARVEVLAAAQSA